MRKRYLSALLLASMIGLPITNTVSAMDAKSIQVMGRVLGFVKGVPEGQLSVAIIYDPAVPESQGEADELRSMFDAGVSVGKFRMSGTMVPVTELVNLSDSHVAIVTSGLSMQYEAIFNATRDAGIASFSADESCVAVGRCVIGIQVNPEVEITLNADAGAATGIEFSQALRMLVKEI